MQHSLNKDTKTPGGTTGFSTNVSAVKRWALSASYRAALRTCFHGHLIYKPQHYKHSDLMPSRIQKDEKDVNTLVCLLNDVFVNPFSEQSLLSISTGISVPEMICKDLLEAERVGKETMETFITKRLTKEREASIFDTIKKLKLKTFDSMKKTKTYKLKDKTIDLQATKDIFSKVAIIAQKRSIDLKQLFEYPLGPLPCSLAEADGTLKKTAKATLLHKIEGEVKPVNDIVDAYAFIAWHVVGTSRSAKSLIDN